MRSGVVCAGVSCLDLFLYGTEPLATRESLSLVRETGYRPGGATSNTGRALAGFGVPAAYFTVVGEDANGDILLSLWQADGVDTRWVTRTREAGTAISAVPIYADGKRGVYHCPGTNAIMGVEHLLDPERLEFLRQSQAFHLGYPPLLQRLQGQALAQLLAAVRETGVLVSLDTTPIPDDASLREMLAPALPMAHLFAPNVEEASQVAGCFSALAARARSSGADVESLVTPDELREIGEALLAMGVPLVVLTLGPNGAYLCTAEAAALRGVPFAPGDLAGWADLRAYVPGYRVDGPANSAGAGDTFTAALLAGALSGTPSLVDAVATAQCAAARHVALLQAQPLAEIARLRGTTPRATPTNPHLRALFERGDECH